MFVNGTTGKDDVTKPAVPLSIIARVLGLRVCKVK